VNEIRKVQRAGERTLLVSIPSDYAKHLGLNAGDNVMVKEEEDGSLRMVPTVRKAKTVKASIRSDLVESDELLSRLIISCYMLGYDSIELTSKERIRPSRLTRASRTVRELRGLEIVESSESRLLAQSFMDPTKFPVDSLIKRLQLLVSRSLEGSIRALRGESPEVLNEIRRIQQEIDELYWLIVRQLLVALSNREISGKIGLESPLHTSGDRVSAKTIEEIGRIILELTEEIISFRETGTKVDRDVLGGIERLAAGAQRAFDVTMASLLTPEMRTIESAMETIDSTLRLEREVMVQFSELEYPNVRGITSDFGQLVRYCSIIVEIALNRLLRKTSRVCVITSQ
jgi:phosphate uptake regulator